MTESRVSEVAVRKHIRELRGVDDVSLALHVWEPDGIASVGVIFYIHGIQSHAGWLHETGPLLAGHGITVVALDRRGSGESGGARGDLISADAVFDDYRAAFAQASLWGPTLAVGQSFGGSILAGLVASDLIVPDGVVFCAPALGQQRFRHANSLPEIRANRSVERILLGFTDDQYTTDDEYLRWMANDPLMIRSITGRTRATMVEIEDTYFSPGVHLPDSILIQPRADTIIDSGAAANVLGRVARSVRRLELPTGSHYIEFSPSRDEYIKILVDAAGRG
ncbi:alpha/beta hydrolase [Gordonia sp. CPCC 205333]|uniref:alpha/beta hydrolase n=1 Tax=Gordonia sp. CPCC 205333 TaxID=3140790 RepID=UPI003AF3CAE6